MPPPPFERATTAKRERRNVEFKQEFDVNSDRDWCEVIKDIVAMANSGGGLIIFGLTNAADPSGFDPAALLALDPAHVTDKLRRYTGEDFADFEVQRVDRANNVLAAMRIEAAAHPLVFIKPGTYKISEREQRTAFSQGTVYFRHGAKSETANAHDLRDWLDSRLEAARRDWLSRVQQVVEAPRDFRLAVVEREAEGEAAPSRIKLVDDPDAPIYGLLDPDDTHPHRQTELVDHVNELLGGETPVTSHDILAIRRTEAIEAATHPTFCHHPRYGSPQYSDAFADWIVGRIREDPDFLANARARYLNLQRQRRAAAAGA